MRDTSPSLIYYIIIGLIPVSIAIGLAWLISIVPR